MTAKVDLGEKDGCLEPRWSWIMMSITVVRWF